VSAPGSLLDQTSSVADQHPHRVGVPRRALQEAAPEAESFSFEQQARDQTSVQRIGLGLLADHQVTTIVEGEVLEPVDAVAMTLYPGSDGAPVPATGRLHPDPGLIRGEAELAEPSGQPAEAQGSRGDGACGSALPGPVPHSGL